MRRAFVLLAAVLASCSMMYGRDAGVRPTYMDLEWAQADGMAQLVGGDPIVHCRRFEAMRCERTSEPETFRCSYREWAEHRPWPRKLATIRHVGQNWTWVEGDRPTCSITVME